MATSPRVSLGVYLTRGFNRNELEWEGHCPDEATCRERIRAPSLDADKVTEENEAMGDNNASNSCISGTLNDVYGVLVDVRVAVSAVSTLCIILVIATIFLFQKHHFFTQRLILYLAFASLFFSIEGCINVVSYEVYEEPQLRRYCTFAGFVNLVTSWWVVMATVCIVLDIFIKVATFKQTERLERCYILTTFVLPVALIGWIPFIDGTYGPAGPICWIRSKNPSNCEDDYFGVALQLALYYVPLFLLMIIVLILLVVSIILLRKKAKEWAGKYDPHIIQVKTRMQAEVHPLFVYPIVLICANILPFVDRLYGAINTTETHASPILFPTFIIYKLQGAFMTVVFALDKETRKKLKRREIIAALRRLMTKNNEIKEYSAANELEESVVHPSYAVEPESMTGYRRIDD